MFLIPDDYPMRGRSIPDSQRTEGPVSLSPEYTTPLVTCQGVTYRGHLMIYYTIIYIYIYNKPPWWGVLWIGRPTPLPL